jgi:hypothetical protein
MDAHRPPPAERSDGKRAGDGEEPPPILGSWRALYAAVIGELLLVIALCYWLSGWHR